MKSRRSAQRRGGAERSVRSVSGAERAGQHRMAVRERACCGVSGVNGILTRAGGGGVGLGVNLVFLVDIEWRGAVRVVRVLPVDAQKFFPLGRALILVHQPLLDLRNGNVLGVRSRSIYVRCRECDLGWWHEISALGVKSRQSLFSISITCARTDSYLVMG